MNFGIEGHKGPRHFLVGGMGARGEQGALAPTPPLEYENVLISVTYPGCKKRGAQGTKAFSGGLHGRPWGVTCPTPPLEYENVLISVTYPGCMDKRAQGTKAFSGGGHGRPWGARGTCSHTPSGI